MFYAFLCLSAESLQQKNRSQQALVGGELLLLRAAFFVFPAESIVGTEIPGDAGEPGRPACLRWFRYSEMICPHKNDCGKKLNRV